MDVSQYGQEPLQFFRVMAPFEPVHSQNLAAQPGNPFRAVGNVSRQVLDTAPERRRLLILGRLLAQHFRLDE